MFVVSTSKNNNTLAVITDWQIYNICRMVQFGTLNKIKTDSFLIYWLWPKYLMFDVWPEQIKIPTTPATFMIMIMSFAVTLFTLVKMFAIVWKQNDMADDPVVLAHYYCTSTTVLMLFYNLAK